jgi:hypothetical protein
VVANTLQTDDALRRHLKKDASLSFCLSHSLSYLTDEGGRGVA